MTMGELRARYLGLMRNCLTGLVYDDPPFAFAVEVGPRPFDRATRQIGMDRPSQAHSMIGQRRMLQLQRAAEFVIERGVPGDFIKTGMRRGGACIMLRAVLEAWGVTDRHVWLADSFAGLPRPVPWRGRARQRWKALYTARQGGGPAHGTYGRRSLCESCLPRKW